MFSGCYDARARVLICSVARLLSIPQSQVEQCEGVFTHELKSRESKESRLEILKVGVRVEWMVVCWVPKQCCKPDVLSGLQFIC